MEALYERKGHQIKNLQTGEVQPFFLKGTVVPNISAAKRESRKIQEANGGLGRGSVKVIPRKNGRK